MVLLSEKNIKRRGLQEFLKRDYLKFYQYKEQNDLYTSGDELQDKNSKIYIGYYHVNKILGPMEGKFHQKTPHKKLSFISGSGLESQLLIETSYDPPSPTPPSTIGTRGGGY